MSEESRRRRLPVLVVSGFLGSGKTTLLRKALAGERLARSLVLVNEAAQVGLDDRIVGSIQGRDVRLLGNGCLCCAIQEDLRQTLLDVVDDAALLSGLERIVIETSGLADPVFAIATLAAHPRLAGTLQLQAVVTVVDAQQALEQVAEFPEFRAQIESADLLVLSKTALAPPERVVQTREMLGGLNPIAETCDADEPTAAERVAGASSRFLSSRALRGWLPAGAAAAVETPAVEGDRYARLATPTAWARVAPPKHTPGVVAFALRSATPLDWIPFSSWFSAMLHTHGRRMLRVKGILALDDTADPVLLNSVRHVVHFPEHLARWPDDERSSCLVFVVRDLDPNDVLRSMQVFVGSPASRFTLAMSGPAPAQ